MMSSAILSFIKPAMWSIIAPHVSLEYKTLSHLLHSAAVDWGQPASLPVAGYARWFYVQFWRLWTCSHNLMHAWPVLASNQLCMKHISVCLRPLCEQVIFMFMDLPPEVYLLFVLVMAIMHHHTLTPVDSLSPCPQSTPLRFNFSANLPSRLLILNNEPVICLAETVNLVPCPAVRCTVPMARRFTVATTGSRRESLSVLSVFSMLLRALTSSESFALQLTPTTVMAAASRQVSSDCCFSLGILLYPF